MGLQCALSPEYMFLHSYSIIVDGSDCQGVQVPNAGRELFGPRQARNSAAHPPPFASIKISLLWNHNAVRAHCRL